MSQRTGSLGDASFTAEINDVNGQVTGVSVVNNSPRTCRLTVGSFTRDFPPGASQSINIPNGQRVTLTDGTVTKSNGASQNVKTFPYWFGFL
jgi:hypothetical protein